MHPAQKGMNLLDTKTLTDALRTFEPDTYTWFFGLYYVIKGRDGLELEWNLCNMRAIPSRVEAIRTNLLKKPVADKPVAPYSPFLSDKENIFAIERTDDMIKEQIGGILLNIVNARTYPAQEFVTGVLPKPVGYAFYGERENGENEKEQVLLMRRANPFVTGAHICIADEDEILPCAKPILKLAVNADFLLMKDACYLFSSAIEKDLSLENRYFAIAARRMGQIADFSIVGDYERLEQNVMTPRNARKFADFDMSILEHISALSHAEREDFLATYGVTIDNEGRMDTYDAEQCELVIDLLCCRSCIDPLGRLSTGNNITPRE